MKYLWDFRYFTQVLSEESSPSIHSLPDIIEECSENYENTRSFKCSHKSVQTPVDTKFNMDTGSVIHGVSIIRYTSLY